MAGHDADIVIFGGGIAGLWILRALKERGYDVLLLEKNAIGSGQTIASQGIIHSGLKYALGGKLLPLAKNIKEMPARWRAALHDRCMAAPSQELFIPRGLAGGIAKAAIGAVFDVSDVAGAAPGGFKGSVLKMNEPVLDMPGVLKVLADTNYVRTFSQGPRFRGESLVEVDDCTIKAKKIIFTAAGGNEGFAEDLGHRIETQARPLLMGMMKPAPFPLYAHFVGTSDKPEATITTHRMKDGMLAWYIGGGVAERAKESSETDLFKAIKKVLTKYMPGLDLAGKDWASLPIDRVEGRGGGWMPDTPTVREHGNILYCWPTKLTFAPLLADMVLEKVKDIAPSGRLTDWSFLPAAAFAETPWEIARWKKL